MALTNDQITAQNFKDFYGQIRPYLNGQVPVFANRFNKSDLYSTDEQLIGRWIDGKPIYQKTIIRNGTISKGANTVDPNVVAEHIVNISGTVFRDRYFTNVVEAEGTTQMVNTYYNNVDHLIHIDALMAYTNATAWITLQYTKPEESTISITDGNEYSTDEQVVGHWIDGSPLYQKTINLGVLPNNSTKDVPHGISNIKEVCSFNGAVYGFAGGVYYALPLPNVGTYNQYIYDIAFNIKGSNLTVVTQSDRTWLEGSVTIRYTKN